MIKPQISIQFYKLRTAIFNDRGLQDYCQLHMSSCKKFLPKAFTTALMDITSKIKTI